MEDKGLDKLFKAEKEKESHDPPTFVWDDLEKDLRRNARKKRFIVWWFVGLLLVSAATFYLYQNKKIINDEASQMTASSINDETKSNTSNVIENNENLNDDKTKDQKTDVVSSNTKEIIRKNIASIESGISNSKTVQQEISNQNYSINDSRNIQDEEKSGNYEISTSFPRNRLSASAKTQLNAKSKYGERTKTNNTSTVSLATRDKVEISTIKNLTFLLSTPLIKIKDLHPGYLERISPDKMRNTLIVSTHVGKPTFSDATFSTTNLQSESDWYSYGLGINYFHEVINQFHVGVGVSFRQSKRKFNYESEELQLRGYGSNSSVSSEPFEYGRVLSQGEQRFTFLDFSTGAQYDILTEGIGISLGLSAIFNFKLKSEGKTLGINREIIGYTDDNNFYQSSLGLGFSPYITFSMALSENLHFTLTPSYSTYFQNIESDRLLRDMKYSNFGLEVGVGRKF